MNTKYITAPEGTAPCSVVIHGLTSNRTERIKFDGSPSPEATKLAGFVVGAAWQLHRRLLPERPETLWYRHDARGTKRLGFADPNGSYVALCDSLEGEKLADTALHETRHLAHADIIADDERAESDASGFARRWLRPMLRAYWATGGALSKLAALDGPKPSGWAPHMDVRLTRSNAKLWQRDNRTVRNAWKELST